jgi:predicted RNA-binding Zn-ribbon protein involved in translation (DUF1610 family)
VQPQYRYLAKKCLAKATGLLKSDDDDDVIYACLEFRKCIEALCYEMLIGYLDEVPLKAFDTWQPDKVMRELLRIDPSADQTSRIRIREDVPDGQPQKNWMDLGEDRRLKAAWAAKTYHQLGNFLHVPTIKQSSKEGAPDTVTIRHRAEAIREHLAHVLDTQIWNANFSVSVTIPCSQCNAPIKRRSSILENGEPIECGNCGQLYDAEHQPDDSYLFVAHCYSWACKVCSERIDLAQSRAKPGADASCPNCGDQATLVVEQVLSLQRVADRKDGGGAST